MDNSLRMLLNGGEKKMSEWMLVWLNRVIRQCRTSNSRRSRSVFLFLMERICWCRTHRGGCRGFVSCSSFDHQLQPTLRHGKYEIRNTTTTKFNQKNSSNDAIRRWIGEVVQVHHPTGTFSFFPRHRLLASNSLTDTPLLLFLLLLPFLLRDLRIHQPTQSISHPPTVDGTVLETIYRRSNIHETFEILSQKNKNWVEEEKGEISLVGISFPLQFVCNSIDFCYFPSMMTFPLVFLLF